MSNHLDHIYEARKASFESTGQYLPDSEILLGPTSLSFSFSPEIGKCSVCGRYNSPTTGVCNCANKVLTPTSTNNGGTTDYYAVPSSVSTLQDLIELKSMNFAQGNIFKAVYRLNDPHHSDAIRDLNKIIWFAQRELSRLQKDPNGH